MTYLKSLLTGLVSIWILLGAINWLIDPFDIWQTPIIIQGFNMLKPERATHQRLYESSLFRKSHAKTMILGTSRADIGLDPKHPALTPPAFNFAMGGQPLRETLALINKASELGRVHAIVFGTDFFTANAALNPPSDAVDSLFAFDEFWKPAFAMDTLLASIKTIAAQHTYDPESAGDIWTRDGLRAFGVAKVRKNGGARKLAISSEITYAGNGGYLPSPHRIFSFRSKTQDTEETYAAILRIAHEQSIDLRIFISPSHARQWELVAALGLWDKWEQWKRMIVRLNEAVAFESGSKPFAIWDFSDFLSINTEEFPPLCDKETTMHWYWESSHYKPALGNLVLDRIFGLDNPDLPTGFGVQLLTSNIDAHLKQIRSRHDLWKASHSIDVAEIQRAASKDRGAFLTEINRQCP